MFKLDDNFLIELGLGSLPVDDKKAMLNHIYETLEMRVGMKLAEQMTNEQLDEFEGFIQRNDEPGALNWLETNFPNYKQVVADELEKLKGEVKAAAPQILAAAGAQAGQPAPAAPAPQSPMQQPAYGSSQPMPQQAPMPAAPVQPMPAPGAGMDYGQPQPSYGPAPAPFPPQPQANPTYGTQPAMPQQPTTPDPMQAYQYPPQPQAPPTQQQ